MKPNVVPNRSIAKGCTMMGSKVTSAASSIAAAIESPRRVIGAV